MSFSQRKKLKPIKSVLQTDSMDMDLRVGLWNALYVFYWRQAEGYDCLRTRYSTIPIFPLLIDIWINYFKAPFDTMSNFWNENYGFIRKNFFDCKWNEVYDFVAFVAQNDDNTQNSKKFIDFCNITFERELSAYRFVDDEIVDITSKEEKDTIESALQISDKFIGARTHIKEALTILSDRKNYEYRNSIKEAISAIEAVCCVISGQEHASLGKALKQMDEQKKIQLHPAFEKGLNNLYGYTSDADGIRHALIDTPNVDFADAKFMLVICSAFVNYLIDKSK